MSKITAVLEPDVDGTLHLPLPADMRTGKVRVVASLEKVGSKKKPTLRITSDGARMAWALEQIAKNGGVASIPDPVAWQREQRKDRPLPGRD